jgi:hypothetical protein
MTDKDAFRSRHLSAAEYVLVVHRPEDRVAILLRNRERGQTMQRILSAEDIASVSFQSWLKQQNDGGADIFIGMNPLRGNSFARTKESIREIRHLYLDLDEQAGASLHTIRTTGDVPPPTLVLDTSAEKHQVVWRVEGFDIPQAESVLRALAAQFGGDPAATDVSRVLRLPGFVNRKYNDAFVVRALHDSETIYQATDFHVREDSPESLRHLNDSQHARKLHRSQSEADWAYAKRALARGDKPDDVIHRIADYRAYDKSDPEYYARHTVSKAQVQIHSENPPLPSRTPQLQLERVDHKR